MSLVRSAWRSCLRLLGVVRNSRGLLVLTLALLAVDLFWIVYFGVGKMLYELGRDPTLYNHKELMITTDGGVPELYGYAKTVLIVALFVRMARSTRQLVYVGLAVTFLLVLLDDALEIHETAGVYFARLLEIRPFLGLRARDVGELITWAILGMLVVPMLALGFARSAPPHRSNGLAFLLAFGGLLFCATFVDQLYHGYKDVFLGAGVLLDMTEDGGELVALTAICALALGAVRQAAEGAEPL